MFNKRSCDFTLFFINNLFKVQCYYCNKYEHYKTNCFKLKQTIKIVINKINKLLKNNKKVRGCFFKKTFRKE